MMNKKIILCSNSPRRRELIAGLDIPYEIKVIGGIDESYPDDLDVMKVAEYVACKKAAAYTASDDEIVLTADTIVVVDGKILGKPHDKEDAKQMLRTISGKTHHVVTGVCLKSSAKQSQFSVVSEVTFKWLKEREIDYYVDKYSPLDKAGAYGIQEWIGYVGVTSIRGSYYNVMGLPVQRIYEELTSMYEV